MGRTGLLNWAELILGRLGPAGFGLLDWTMLEMGYWIGPVGSATGPGRLLDRVGYWAGSGRLLDRIGSATGPGRELGLGWTGGCWAVGRTNWVWAGPGAAGLWVGRTGPDLGAAGLAFSGLLILISKNAFRGLEPTSL